MSSQLLRQISPLQTYICRCLQTSTALSVNRRSGVPKITNNRSKKLTYEEAQKPEHIAVSKYWNSFNTSNLHIEKEYELWLSRSSETAIEDAYIRRFTTGVFQGLIDGTIIIKRQFNTISLAFLVQHRQRQFENTPYYFLRSFTETILSTLTKCPVKIDMQVVTDRDKLVFKKI